MNKLTKKEQERIDALCSMGEYLTKRMPWPKTPEEQCERLQFIHHLAILSQQDVTPATDAILQTFLAVLWDEEHRLLLSLPAPREEYWRIRQCADCQRLYVYDPSKPTRLYCSDRCATRVRVRRLREERAETSGMTVTSGEKRPYFPVTALDKESVEEYNGSGEEKANDPVLLPTGRGRIGKNSVSNQREV